MINARIHKEFKTIKSKKLTILIFKAIFNEMKNQYTISKTPLCKADQQTRIALIGKSSQSCFLLLSGLRILPEKPGGF
jgi:hypothetical protein